MAEHTLERSPHPLQKHVYWWRLLVGGAVLFGFSVLLLFVTGNPTLFPTVVLLGNFVVPVSYVSFFYERKHLSTLTMPTTASAFVLGGLLGVLAAATLEPLFVGGQTTSSYVLIPAIEELVKVVSVVAIVRRWRCDTELDGMILGAAAGMGFAALESTGYAFGAFLRSGGSLTATFVVTLIRGATASLGHGTWTAILTGALFRAGHAGRVRLTGRVLAAYVLVVALHGLWNLAPSATSGSVMSALGALLPLVVVGGVGLAILWWRWRGAVRAQAADSTSEVCAPA